MAHRLFVTTRSKGARCVGESSRSDILVVRRVRCSPSESDDESDDDDDESDDDEFEVDSESVESESSVSESSPDENV